MKRICHVPVTGRTVSEATPERQKKFCMEREKSEKNLPCSGRRSDGERSDAGKIKKVGLFRMERAKSKTERGKLDDRKMENFLNIKKRSKFVAL